MRTTRMLGMTAVLLCASLIFGSPSAFAAGAMDPPAGGDSGSSESSGGHDADPPEVADVDPPQVEGFDPPAPSAPRIQQPADPGGDFVPAGAAIDAGVMNPWWVITDFKGRCALAHQPTFDLGYLLKGPFGTFAGGAAEMGAQGAPGWPVPVPAPASGAPSGSCTLT